MLNNFIQMYFIDAQTSPAILTTTTIVIIEQNNILMDRCLLQSIRRQFKVNLFNEIVHTHDPVNK